MLVKPPSRQSLQRAVGECVAMVQRHRRAALVGVVGALGGFAVTAVAIAPLAPDANDLPRRLVTEAVAIDDLAAQIDALAGQRLTLNRSEITRATDTPSGLLARLGVTDPSAAAFLREDRTARLLLSGRGGKLVHAQALEDGSLVELVARFPSDRSELARTHFQRLSISRVDGRWLANLQTVPYGNRVRLAGGVVRSSLFAATDEAGVPDAVATQLADIFSVDIDFHRELRKGDTFSVVYESLTADGEPVPWNEGAGRVLAAEFVASGRAHHAVWFTPSDGRGGYFGLDGKSRRRMFLASPVEFSRMSSGFAQRFHPILRSWRQHLGVDYSAPTGTGVRAVGDGTVEFAGWQNGYGNVVKLRHGGDRETLYAHLSRIDVRRGQRVEQGQRVGAVGSTGWSTGPHLHFEFRVRGVHQDPLVIARAAETVALDNASRQRFGEVVAQMRGTLDVAESLGPATVRTRFE